MSKAPIQKTAAEHAKQLAELSAQRCKEIAKDLILNRNLMVTSSNCSFVLDENGKIVLSDTRKERLEKQGLQVYEMEAIPFGSGVRKNQRDSYITACKFAGIDGTETDEARIEKLAGWLATKEAGTVNELARLSAKLWAIREHVKNTSKVKLPELQS